MTSGSGGPFAETPTKALRAMVQDPSVTRDPNRKRLIENELRVRREQSERARGVRQ